MSTIPTFIYKITPTAPPSPLPHALPLSSLDAQDGFIHLSIAAQIPKTADLFFDQHTTLWLLRLDRQVVENEGGKFVRRPDAVTGPFVHMYGKDSVAWDGARLGEGTIISIRECKRKDNQKWDDAPKACFDEGWLVDV